MPRRDTEIIYENEEEATFEIGKGKILVDGEDLTIIATGEEVPEALRAGEILKENGISAEIVEMATIKPIDEEIIKNQRILLLLLKTIAL